jgi:hypothetical protein
MRRFANCCCLPCVVDSNTVSPRHNDGDKVGNGHDVPGNGHGRSLLEPNRYFLSSALGMVGHVERMASSFVSWGQPNGVMPFRVCARSNRTRHGEREALNSYVLLSVMDGFVNEFESARRGLHTREAEELDARDSVVGHHMGLTRAHATFTRRKGATSDEPVYELYRHGIVHGTILSYDNDVVATKAWNRLFAVTDWAKAKVKEQQPPKREPTWRELFAQLADNARKERANKEWKPETVVPSDSSFETHPARVVCEHLLKSSAE